MRNLCSANRGIFLLTCNFGSHEFLQAYCTIANLTEETQRELKTGHHFGCQFSIGFFRQCVWLVRWHIVPHKGEIVEMIRTSKEKTSCNSSLSNEGQFWSPNQEGYPMYHLEGVSMVCLDLMYLIPRLIIMSS